MQRLLSLALGKVKVTGVIAEDTVLAIVNAVKALPLICYKQERGLTNIKKT